jgi:hypothetical protein
MGPRTHHVADTAIDGTVTTFDAPWPIHVSKDEPAWKRCTGLLSTLDRASKVQSVTPIKKTGLFRDGVFS